MGKFGLLCIDLWEWDDVGSIPYGVYFLYFSGGRIVIRPYGVGGECRTGKRLRDDVGIVPYRLENLRKL